MISQILFHFHGSSCKRQDDVDFTFQHHIFDCISIYNITHCVCVSREKFEDVSTTKHTVVDWNEWMEKKKMGGDGGVDCPIVRLQGPVSRKTLGPVSRSSR